MSWPLPQDFNEAVQNPGAAFSDPDLKAAEPILGAQGLPLPRSGNFADVYQVRSPDGRHWAVKCFTRPVTGLEHRYAKIGETLDKASLPFTVGFTFLASGIRVRGQWRPVVKMEWVEGLLLTQVVRDNAGRPTTLASVSQMWGKLCRRLREAGIAHADIQHGNVLLVPGAKPGSYGLKLIDYDGMYVPTLANNPAGEAGHPNFQHPGRLATRAYSPDLDRFPHLVVATALRALEDGGTALWERYDTGDNLLFVEDDFKAPGQSALMRELWMTGSPAVRALVGRLAIACVKPIPQTPWLDQIAPDGQPTPLEPEATRAAEAALGLATTATIAPLAPLGLATTATITPLAPLLTPSPSKAEAFADLDDKAEPAPQKKTTRRLGTRILEEPAEPVRRSGTRRTPPRRKKKKAPILLIGAIVTGLSVLVAAGIGAVLIFASKKPAEVTKVESATDQKPAPPEPNPPTPDGPQLPIVPKIDTPQPPPTDPVGTGAGGAEVAPFNPDPAGAASMTLRWEAPTRNRVWIKTSLDNRWVLAYEPGTQAVRVFSSANGTDRGTFRNGTQLWEFIPMPNGRVASWAPDQPNAVIWDALTLTSERSLPLGNTTSLNGGRQIVFDVSYDQRYVATGFHTIWAQDPGPSRPEDCEARVFDTQTQRELFKTSTRGQIIRFTPDGGFVLAEVDRCRWYKLPAGTVESEARLPQVAKGYVAAISQDGRRVVFVRDGTPTLIDTRTGAVLAEYPGRVAFKGLPLSPDGRWLAVGVPRVPGAPDRFSYLEVIEIRTGRVAGRFMLDPAGKIEVTTAYFTADSKAVAIGLLGSRIQMIDLRSVDIVVAPPKATPRPGPFAITTRWSTDTPAGSGHLVADRDGLAVVIVPAAAAGPIQAFRATNGAPLPGLNGFSSPAHAVLPLGRGRIAVCPSADAREAMVFDLQSGQLVDRIRFPDCPAPTPPPGGGLVGGPQRFLSPDGRYAAASSAPTTQREGDTAVSGPGAFRVAEVATGKIVLSTDWLGGRAFFTADGARVLLVESGGRFRWFQLPSGQQDTSWAFPAAGPSTPEKATGAFAMSADGGVILYSGPTPEKGSSVKALDGRTGRVIRGFPTSHSSLVGAVSPDGRYVALPRLPELPDGATILDLYDLIGLQTIAIRVDRGGPGMAIPAFPSGGGLAFHRGTKLGMVDFDGGQVAAAPKANQPQPMPPVPKMQGPGPASGGQEPITLKPRWVAPIDVNESVPIIVDSTAGAVVAGSVVFNLRTGALVPGFADPRRARHTTPLLLDQGRVGIWDRSGPDVKVVLAITGRLDPKLPAVTIPELPGGGRLWARQVVLSPNAKYLAVGKTDRNDDTPPNSLPLVVIDTATRKSVYTSTWDGGTMFFTGDSSRLLVAEETGRHRWVNIPSGQLHGEWSYPRSPKGRVGHEIDSASHDGRVLGYRGPGPDDRIGGTRPRLLNGETGEVLMRYTPRGGAFSRFTVAGDGRLAAVINKDLAKGQDEGYVVEVLDIPTGAVFARVTIERKPGVQSGGTAALSPDSRHLALSDSASKSVYLFDIPIGGAIASLPNTPSTPATPSGPVTPSTPSTTAAARVSIPAEDAQAKALKEVRDTFKEEFAKKTVSEKKALAQKLLTVADDTKDEQTVRYVLLREAQNLAVEIGDAALAIQAADGLARGFEVDATIARATVLEKLISGPSGAITARPTHDSAMAAAVTAFEAGDYATAARFAGIAAAAARKGTLGAGVIQDSELLTAQAKKWGEGLAAVKPALGVLKATPDDPEANLAVGRFQCFIQGKWSEGLKHLAKGSHAGLKAAAEADLAAQDTPDLKVADAWREAAMSVPEADRWPVDARRRYWDVRVAASLTGLARLKIENRLGLTAAGVEYRLGLAADFTTRQGGNTKSKKSRIEPTIDFTTTDFTEPGSAVVEVTGKWVGAILPPRAGMYKIVADCTDPVRVRVDGKLVFDSTAKGASAREGVVVLGERPAPILVEFTGPALSGHKLKLKWASPGGDEDLIPAECLVHDRKAEAGGK